MKKVVAFLFVNAVHAVLLCALLSLLAIWGREGMVSYEVRIGWPLIFFHVFDCGNPDLNHGGDVPNLIYDYMVAFVLSVPMVLVYRRLLGGRW